MLKKKKRTGFQLTLRVVLLLTLFVLGWYGFGRILSPWRVVRIVDTGATVVLAGHTDDSLRVVAYNIAHGRGTGDSNWSDAQEREKRLGDIAALLIKFDADIVVLNEVDIACVWSGHGNQADKIAEAAGYRYRAELRNIDASVPFASLRFGNAVLSRYPIVEAEVINLPGYAAWETVLGGKKRALACMIELDNGSRVAVVAAHLDTRGDETIRIESARAIVDAVSGSGIPTVIAGDLNSTLPDLPGAQLGDSGATGVSTFLDTGGFVALPVGERPHTFAATFPSWEPDRAIDWILVSPRLSLTRIDVEPSDLSDHLPVVAEIRLPPDTVTGNTR